ncbi:MAG: cytochrome c biogenesis protein CcsA [Chloroflexi bacterium]|nr:cytochrome c biogenesis protein CcsA [Chloroflexota bacterium]
MMPIGAVLKNGLFVVSATMMLVVLYLVFMWVPTDNIQGTVQRIMYFHVPVAWVAFLAFFIVLVGSVGYLWKRTSKWDQLAYSAAEIGVLLTTLLLITGIIWAKPIWGVWWTWEPRLTTSLMLWLIYVAYLMLRAYSPPGDQGARYAAVLGIIGFIDVPIVYYSVKLWRTVHPQVIVGPAATGELDSSMRILLLIAAVTFTLLFVYLLTDRFSLRKSEDEVELARGLAESLR